MGPYIRIALRYLAGVLVGAGVFTPELATQLANDPDVIQIATEAVNWGMVAGGTLLGAITERVYAFAKKHGWAT
jgi:hypothetical protein